MIITLHTWAPADKPALIALCREGVWRSIWVDGQLVGSISVERKVGGENKVGEPGF